MTPLERRKLLEPLALTLFVSLALRRIELGLDNIKLTSEERQQLLKYVDAILLYPADGSSDEFMGLRIVVVDKQEDSSTMMLVDRF